MSKWKDPAISIIQVVSTKYDVVLGLGSDSKVYRWDESEGGWKKNWTVKDMPEEGK